MHSIHCDCPGGQARYLKLEYFQSTRILQKFGIRAHVRLLQIRIECGSLGDGHRIRSHEFGLPERCLATLATSRIYNPSRRSKAISRCDDPCEKIDLTRSSFCSPVANSVRLRRGQADNAAKIDEFMAQYADCCSFTGTVRSSPVAHCASSRSAEVNCF